MNLCLSQGKFINLFAVIDFFVISVNISVPILTTLIEPARFTLRAGHAARFLSALKEKK